MPQEQIKELVQPMLEALAELGQELLWQRPMVLRMLRIGRIPGRLSGIAGRGC